MPGMQKYPLAEVAPKGTLAPADTAGAAGMLEIEQAAPEIGEPLR